MKTFTYQVQTGSDDTSWRTDTGFQLAHLDDDWTTLQVAYQASNDHEKVASDEDWRIVVWTGDATGEDVREPDVAVLGNNLRGACWCSEEQIYSGHYEWYCPSHGDRSWRPEAKAFQAGRAS